MAKTGQFESIDTVVGVEPVTDNTRANTKHFTYSDKIRFENGVPRKIGGWINNPFDYGDTVDGTTRTIFTDTISGKNYMILGTQKKLYSVIGSRLTNITPLVTVSTPAANSLSTQYGTLVNNPFSATIGDPNITVQDAEAARFQLGDQVNFSGATGFAGLLAGDINGDTIIREIGVGFYKVNFGVTPTSTATGGGASVTRFSGLINVAKAAHGQLDEDRVKIDLAVDTGGILAAEINKEHIIRNSLVNSFDVMTTGTATSSVTAGGGGATIYYIEIPDGRLDQSVNQGYGAGLYGMGLYGTALTSTSAIAYPRIWFVDRYANTIIATPGNQGGLYQWLGDTNTAPVQIVNAPTAINYAFVSNNILVTFGAENGGNPTENRIFASDQNNITQWTSSSTNQVYDDDIEGAGRLISHVPVEDYNLIFTEDETYTFRYIGLPFVWEVKELDNGIGIIAPMARTSAKGVGFWMGKDNFYMYRGGTIEIIPANSQSESTCLHYVFGDMNWGQKSKIFAFYNRQYNEVWFHYPSANSNECNRVVVVNLADYTWTIHTMDRTAAEYPSVKLKNPRLANVGMIYQHEIGKDADGAPMPFTLSSDLRYYGKANANLNAVIPDSIQTGTISFRNVGYLYPMSPVASYNEVSTITTITDYVPVVSSSRFHIYTWSGSELGQEWAMGNWFEEIQRGPTE